MTPEERKKYRLIFMGTPDFAVASLKALHEAGFTICAVLTTPDKPAGRGRKLQECPVKKYARENDMLIIAPEKLRDENAIPEIQNLNADLGVVVAFKKLPEEIYTAPRLGTFNLHGSLLPAYRGAAPIHRAVMNGESKSGVTTFLLNDKIDEGEIFYREEVEIGENTTTAELYKQLMKIGAQLVVKTADDYLAGKIKSVPQPESSQQKNAPKIFRDDCRIDWSKPINDIHNHIRGLSTYPGAFTEMIAPRNQSIKILKSRIINQEGSSSMIETQHIIEKNSWKIQLPDGLLEIIEVQPQGKPPMPAAAFINGLPKDEGVKLK